MSTVPSETIRLAVTTGSVRLGYRESLRLAIRGRLKLLLVASNLDGERARRLEEVARLSGVPLVKLSYSSRELGSICELRHPVSVVGVRDPGVSDILRLTGNEQQ
jgi:large subunit ribosomal protein L30e